MKNQSSAMSAFSLVELLIVLLVLGVILFLAFPNIVQVKSDSEKELAKARVSALNMAAAAYFQARGQSAAASWTNAATDDARYNLIKDYIAFPAATLSNFLPSSDYDVDFNPTSPHRIPAVLKGPPGLTNISY